MKRHKRSQSARFPWRIRPFFLAAVPLTVSAVTFILAGGLVFGIVTRKILFGFGGLLYGLTGSIIAGMAGGILLFVLVRNRAQAGNRSTGRRAHTIQVATSAEKAIEICREALGQVPHAAIHADQSGERRLVVRAGATVSRGSSWITCTVQSKSAEKQLVTIENRPVWPPLLAHSGKHELIVAEIVAHFDARGLLI